MKNIIKKEKKLMNIFKNIISPAPLHSYFIEKTKLYNKTKITLNVKENYFYNTTC